MPESIQALDTAPCDVAARWLRPCCASERWIAAVLGARPVGDLDGLLAVSDAALGALPWPEIEQALNAHPRIGEHRGGLQAESRWSREEQSTTAGHLATDTQLQAALAEGNLAYERRFGHVFLIRAAGRTAGEILSALRDRLACSPEQEQQTVRQQLAEIVRLRLGKAFA